MIEVDFYFNENKLIKGFELRGHSGLEFSGKDIVCAGVSTLVQTVFLGLTIVLQIEVIFKQKNGAFYLALPLNLMPDKEKEALILLNTMLLGLQSIQELFPKELKIVLSQINEPTIL